MRNVKLTNLLLITMLALCACATPETTGRKPAEVPAAKLPPPPEDVMVIRQPNFQMRLVNFFLISPAKPMK